jgi:HPt (histidine-containing phosphotransfer) domain-containing protein
MSEPPDSSAKEMEELLQSLWTKNYGLLQERLKLIRDAHDRMAVGSLDNQTRCNAESAAHKLAGILGTFGLPHGSALASKIETSLAAEAPAGLDFAPQLQSWLTELESIIASRQ